MARNKLFFLLKVILFEFDLNTKYTLERIC